MKKITVLFLCLAFLSLACLGSGAASRVEQLPTAVQLATLTNSPAPGAGTSAPTLALEPDAPRCAVVIAAESLHLRGGSSEAAEVLTWLNRGVVVELVSDSDPNWWRVKLGDLEGFARSIYLQESECEQ